MKKAFLIFIVAHLGACTTSSAPTDGVDGGGGSGFDAATVDVPFFDSAPSRFDAAPQPDVGGRDAGPPVEFDSGPVFVDAGPDEPDTSIGPDSGPDDCMSEGRYGLEGVPENDQMCGLVGSQCRVSATASDSTLTLNCGGVALECSQDPFDCSCTGIAEVAGFMISVNIDFLGERANFSGAGVSCDFTMQMR